MNAKTETEGASALDTVKTLLAAAVMLGGIVAYYYFPDVSVAIRAAGVVFGIAAALAIFATTQRGRALWSFIQSSRVELRKVVWPNRQETVQTTIAVIVFAIIMGVFFWLLDMFLLWATRLLTGQGG